LIDRVFVCLSCPVHQALEYKSRSINSAGLEILQQAEDAASVRFGIKDLSEIITFGDMVNTLHELSAAQIQKPLDAHPVSEVAPQGGT
jgi:hypothetical protein